MMIFCSRYLEFLKLYSPEVAWEKSASEHYSQFGDDVSGKGLVFFPSLKVHKANEIINGMINEISNELLFCSLISVNR